MLCGSHIKIWNLANHMKKMKQRTSDSYSFQFFINKSSILICYVLIFPMVCKISNFNMWTARHLVQASCTELTLTKIDLYSLHFCCSKRRRSLCKIFDTKWCGFNIRHTFWILQHPTKWKRWKKARKSNLSFRSRNFGQ